jgi:hypothetical protein
MQQERRSGVKHEAIRGANLRKRQKQKGGRKEYWGLKYLVPASPSEEMPGGLAYLCSSI